MSPKLTLAGGVILMLAACGAAEVEHTPYQGPASEISFRSGLQGEDNAALREALIAYAEANPVRGVGMAMAPEVVQSDAFRIMIVGTCESAVTEFRGVLTSLSPTASDELLHGFDSTAKCVSAGDVGA